MPRYLAALGLRAQRAVVDLDKDRHKWSYVRSFIEQLNELLASLTPQSSAEKRCAVEEFYWMTEEFKISVFTQEIGTDGPISSKRLKKKLEEIDRMI